MGLIRIYNPLTLSLPLVTVVTILFSVIFSPIPVFPHFVWPLSNCILADICNHTWIPECGEEIIEEHTDYRLFIDDCDMYEYNCDYDRKYELANYSSCFGPATGCPTLKPKNYYRMGDYKFFLEGRKIVYAPSERTKKPFNPATLPMHMLKGKRRYTPEVRRRMLKQMKLNKLKKLHTRTLGTTFTMTKTTKMTTLESYVIKKVTVIKNGQKMFRVVKGFKKVTTKMDSEFLE